MGFLDKSPMSKDTDKILKGSISGSLKLVIETVPIHITLLCLILDPVQYSRNGVLLQCKKRVMVCYLRKISKTVDFIQVRKDNLSWYAVG